jgi:SAM-dependent methyltransferase
MVLGRLQAIEGVFMFPLAPGVNGIVRKDVQDCAAERRLHRIVHVAPEGDSREIQHRPSGPVAARFRKSAVARIFGSRRYSGWVFPDQSFDAVTCAFALMFCPDMDRAVAEVHRVLKPGGRVAYVVWDDPSKSPFITAAGQSVARFFPATPPSPNTPGVFRLAQPGALERLLRAGGFADVTVESRPMTLECASADEYWRMFTDHAAGIKTKIAQLSDADRAALMSAVAEAVSPYLDNGRLRLVATPLCASGRR